MIATLGYVCTYYIYIYIYIHTGIYAHKVIKAVYLAISMRQVATTAAYVFHTYLRDNKTTNFISSPWCVTMTIVLYIHIYYVGM